MVKSNADILYFLGIGGIGMSALARYFLRQGCEIHGYDLTPTPLTRQLELEGMKIHYEENLQLIPAAVKRVIYTPAIPASHKELLYFKEQGIELIKRAQVLGELSNELVTIAVAGSHGKTSVTALIAHLLKTASLPVLAFIGGISKNINGNFWTDDKPEFMVVEADEFDRSLLRLQPDIAVVTSMDADHLDIYETEDQLKEVYLQFVHKLGDSGKLVVQEKLSALRNEPVQKWVYGLGKEALIRAEQIEVKEGKIVFDVFRENTLLTHIRMQIPGLHYVENALAAFAVGLVLNIDVAVIRQALESFTGVQRRFDIRFQRENCVFIDDYAHHPEELKATIKAVRMLFPNQKLSVVFQPHLYSRTRDFAAGFAEALSLADEVFLLDIYPAREMPIPGITSKMIFDQIQAEEKHLFGKAELLNHLRSYKPQLLVSMGAGDIGLMVNNIEQILCT
ncbi:MAG: UDP-N-acetylmuramate--L-alanine ligase [Bacteroidales bacterium]|nr:UDP-N-acetylmuramate--L-alanine ligase [Bacteroidales bacterium]